MNFSKGVILKSDLTAWLAAALSTTHWQFWALLSAVFAALTAICAKVGVEGVDSNLATFFRTLVVLLVLGTLLMVSGKLSLPSLTGKATVFLILSGLATGASWLCYFRALQLGEASRVAPLDKMSVVLVAIFGVVFLGEQLSMLATLGIGLITMGAILMVIG